MQNTIPDNISIATRQNIEMLVQRDLDGQIEYGQSLDRSDFSFERWLIEEIEELADTLGYKRAQLNKIREGKSGENTLNTLKTASKSPHPSNAVELPYTSLFLLNLNEFTKSVEYADFVATFRKYFKENEHAAKVLANLLDNMEADRLLANPDETPSPDFMLKMVGEVTKNVETPHAIQRMFEACGRPVKFVNVTDMAEFREANKKANTGEPKNN